MRTTLILVALISAAGAQGTQQQTPQGPAPQQQQTQQQQEPQQQAQAQPPAEIDQLALKVLQTVLDPLKEANSYSFRAQVSRERMGTDGQMITQIRETTVTVSKPDRLRIDVRRGNNDVSLLFDHGDAVLYSPDRKLYARIAAPATISEALDRLETRRISFPTSNLLRPDPYASLAPDLTRAYVIGATTLDGVNVTQLAFTEPGATWQVWVEGGAAPRVRRLEIIYLDRPGHPRVRVDFSDWKIGGSVDPALFAFTPPPDAHEITLLGVRAGD